MSTILRRILSAICFLVLAAVPGYGLERAWEEVDRAPIPPVEQHLDPTDRQPEPDVVVADGYVYITVRERTNVKIFTILGQLIVQNNLQPGVYRFRLSARGIYLLKVGDATRRVTL